MWGATFVPAEPGLAGIEFLRWRSLFFQTNGHQTAQAAVEQQQVDKELFAVDSQPIMTPHKG